MLITRGQVESAAGVDWLTAGGQRWRLNPKLIIRVIHVDLMSFYILDCFEFTPLLLSCRSKGLCTLFKLL